MPTQEQVREELAAAVTGVAGVSCTPFYRQSLKPGDAFVRLATRTRDGSALGYADTWQVWVAVHQDVVTAEKWLSAHVDDVADALAPVLNLNTITPATLAVTTGASVAGVIFEGIREAG